MPYRLVEMRFKTKGLVLFSISPNADVRDNDYECFCNFLMCEKNRQISCSCESIYGYLNLL